MTGSRARSSLRRSTVLLVLATLAAVLVVGRVVEPMRVSSGSMAPSYREGDEVLVEKLSGRSESPVHGDVVAFRRPGSGALMVKRVVGLPGQWVGIADGFLVVADHRVDEPYVDHDTVYGTYFGPVRVPERAVFVMGDARAGSVDSRTFGAVPTDALVGRIVLRMW